MSPLRGRVRQKPLRRLSVARKKIRTNTVSTSPAPEDQVKTFTLSYPEFCLLIAAVAARADSVRDSSGDLSRLYKRLRGEV